MAVGGYLTKVALGFDYYISRITSVKAVLVRLCQNLDYPSPSILEALKEIEIIMEKGREICEVARPQSVDDLQ